ncbi:hypothetical protein P700755_002687 [Psychroflexus torquis ATCC 700755]|uniref:Lipoprotein n=1 Tax=Psychroflexus torquis (strain ATCC 700755 / CIP 106069 / ACAM 623) TaxID=313595 RepID=K4IHY8_PSYTT|nr:hypothetical protein [Psychroflexus torquis]AFU69428.1 hypothetical protein P700755_002687 [Psychroflexus torquis ATCC 700755]
MKNNKIVFLLTFSFLISCHSEKNKRPSDELISIYVQDKKYNYQDLIIIGKINNDTIIPITDWDNDNKKEIKERNSLLNKYNEFYIKYSDINEVINIDKIEEKNFACSELTVGASNKYHLNLENKFSLATNFPDYDNFINQSDTISLDPKHSEIIKEKMLISYSIRKHGKTGNDYNFFNYKTNYLKILDSFTTEKEDSLQVLVEGSILNESIFMVFKLNNDYVEFIGEIESWSNGLALIGVTDLNDNGSIEYFFRGIGYESTGFDIYEIKDNELKLIFRTIPYGC